MSTFALSPGDSLGDIISGLNYVLANMGQPVYYDGNLVVANITTGQIYSVDNNGLQISESLGYLYKYIDIAYANSADGSVDFSTTNNYKQYYGIRNTPNTTYSLNPTDYVWYQSTNLLGASSLPANNYSVYYYNKGGGVTDFIVANATYANSTFGNYTVAYGGDPTLGGNTVIDITELAPNLVATFNIQSQAVTTTTIATEAVTNTTTAGYYSNYLNQSLYKRPKLINYSYYTWTANNNSLITAATITPTESNSTLLVSYSLFFDNDTNSTANNYVALWRSCNEGLLDPLLQQGPYSPYFPYQFRKVRVVYNDPNSTANIANTTVVIGGFDHGNSWGYTQLGSFATGQFSNTGTYANAILVSNATSTASYSYINQYNGTSYTGYQMYWGSLNAVQYNNTVYVEYPPGNFVMTSNTTAAAMRGNVTATDWELWGTYTGSGSQVNHPYMFATLQPGYQSYMEPNGYSLMTGDNWYSIIGRVANSGPAGNIVVTMEANIDCQATNPYTQRPYGKINAIAHDVAPYSTTRVVTAVAVGDRATIKYNPGRQYWANGVVRSIGLWMDDYTTLGGYQPYSGNLNAVAYSGPTDSQVISTLARGAGKDANTTCSNTFVAVGEDGIIIARRGGSTGFGAWDEVNGLPPQVHTTDLRGICYDAYRFRWWVVGDYGTILWANDFNAGGNIAGLVFNTYNSGTLRNLYDITWDPKTGFWTAVGDGIVITDDGTTTINGQKSYPQGKAYAFDAMAGLYGTTPNISYPLMNYEPLPVASYNSGPTTSVLDGFNDYNQTGGNVVLRATPGTVTANIIITPGQVIAGQYAEVPNPVEDAVIFNHNSYTPVTFYLVAGCATGSNLIVGSPTITIQEIKR